jgi:hypothetical protein
MRTYTVHEPPSVPWTSVEEKAEKLELVPDRYSFWAFLLGPLWLLWNRMWLEAAGYVAVLLLGYGGLWLIGANADAVGLWPLLLGIILGFTGNDLRRAALRRRGFTEKAAVTGGSQMECELKAISGLSTGQLV